MSSLWLVSLPQFTTANFSSYRCNARRPMSHWLRLPITHQPHNMSSGKPWHGMATTMDIFDIAGDTDQLLLQVPGGLPEPGPADDHRLHPAPSVFLHHQVFPAHPSSQPLPRLGASCPSPLLHYQIVRWGQVGTGKVMGVKKKTNLSVSFQSEFRKEQSFKNWKKGGQRFLFEAPFLENSGWLW